MIKNLLKLFSFTFLFLLFLFSQTSFAQLTGTKNIPGDYATITAAVTDLNTQGVGAGGVTFNVAAGYTELTTADITITATGIAGNSIVFQKSGVGANPLITRTDAGINATSTLGGLGDAIIRLDGTDYITFDGIDVTASDQGIEYGYFTHKPDGTNGCQFVTVKNAVVTMTKGISAFVMGIYIGNGTTSVSSATGVTVTASSGINSDIIITGNTIQNVHAGVYVRGSSATGFSDNNVIIGQSGAGNIIQNFGGGSATTTYGVYCIYVNGVNASYNNINNTAGGGANFTSTGYGIFNSTTVTGSIIANFNNINLISTSSQLHGISNSATGNLEVNNNSISIGNSTTSSSTYAHIYNSSAAASITVNINNNTFLASTIFTTGSTYLIYNNSSQLTPGITNVQNNSNTGLINRTGASGTFYCYYNNGSPTSTENIFNNTFSNISLAGTSTFYGILSTTASAHTHNIYNNSINNIIGGSGTMYGIHRTIASGNIYNNSVFNFSGGGTVWGISCGSGNVSIYKNSVYNLSSASIGTTAGTVTGIYISGSTNTYIFNNFISDLKAPTCASTDAVRGIGSISTTASSNIGLYYNTIYLNASSSGLNFGSSGVFVTTSTTSTSAALDMRNNIIVNNSTAVGTGLTVAYRRSSSSLTNYASASNNNNLFAANILYDGTTAYTSLAAYKALVTPRDASSFTENPPFVDISNVPYNLHMNTGIATQTESGGTPVSIPIAINDDFDGNTRNISTPDVGADEFAGIGLDLSAPIISYTPLLNTGSTSARTLVVSVTDASGVPTTTPGWPNLYWSINAGAYTAVTPTSVVGSDYTYDFGTGVTAGDVVSYYVVAQDLAGTPNVGAFPSAGAGGFTINPPAAATAPTTPSSYTVTAAGLSGDYTVGLLAFNQLTGRNVTFEKSIRKVMVEVPVEDELSNQTERNELTTSGYTAGTSMKSVEIEEVSWRPMENGKPYLGDLYIKKSENPQMSFPEGIEGVYSTITAAVADLNLRGVSGATSLLLVDATYPSETYPITVNIQNSSLPTAVNTVTIKPSTGVTATISGTSAAGPVLRIRNSFVTIDGSNSGGTTRDLTIENISITTPQVLQIVSSGTTSITNVTVKNSNIINGINTSSALVINRRWWYCRLL